LEDYVTHRIIPPEPDLRRQYLAKIEQQQKKENDGRKERTALVIKKFEQRVAWWNKTFKFGKGKPSRSSKNNENEGGFLNGVRNLFSLGTRTVNADAFEATEGRSAVFSSDGEFIQNSAPMPLVADLISISDDSLDVSAAFSSFGARVEQSKSRDSGPSPAGAIKLKKWNPKTPYLSKLKKAKSRDWYSTYLLERKENEGSSAFFLDVSDFFLEKKQPGLALRILSNVAEMELENPQLLRILGYRLMQIGRPKLAVAVFEEVLNMREEEPQSYRDLALALAADKQHQRAVDLLRQVVEGKWNGRFPEIELTALNEMNAILATCGKKLEAGNLDKRLLKNLPVDVRVILTWDADNTDMDLWVTDPNGEKCFYSHRDTRIGGHISPDYTGGYGPEEFLLKRAQPGKYLVHANYYGNRQQVIAGATTIQLEMTTDFGKPIAKTESVTLRLQGSKEIIKVGEFVIPGKRGSPNPVKAGRRK
jgi:tetratricopeptide (TPR) repeat protein